MANEAKETVRSSKLMQVTEVKAFHLSHQQAHLWSFQHESSIYRSQCLVKLQGTLDRNIFQHALQRLVDRHEILRTGFYRMPGMDVPLQIVAEETENVLPVIDLRQLPPTEQYTQIDMCFAAFLREPVDLEAHPLLFACLFHLSSDEHMLLLNLPALCADSTTLKLLVIELGQAYSAHFAGESLSYEPLQYADVSAWQNKLRLSGEEEPHRLHWRELRVEQFTAQLASFFQQSREDSAHLNRDVLEATEPQHIIIPVDEALATQIRLQAQRYIVSVPAWILACWQIALYRLSGEPDGLVGVTCDGRVHGDLATALGLYSREVPLHTHLAADLPFDQVVTLVHKALLDATRWQAYFTWDLIEKNAAESLSDAIERFFPVGFEYESWFDTFHTGTLDISFYRRLSSSGPILLKLNACEVGTRLHLELLFHSHLLDASLIARLAASLHALLTHLIAHPQASLSSLPLLSPSEIAAQLHLARSLASPLPVNALHPLIERQAARWPLLPAVRDTYASLSYQQLNAQANRLARLLRLHGVTPHSLVAFCLPRDFSSLVALLAILKAGATYLPLDPQTPMPRLLSQLQQASVSYLLTHHSLLPLFADWQGRCLCLEDVQND